MKELQKLMDDIAEWSDATFKGQRNTAIAYYLKKEINELIKAIEKYNERNNEQNSEKVYYEFADCFMLLLDSAKHFGVTANGLRFITRQKLEINKKRKWGKPDKNGVIEHLK